MGQQGVPDGTWQYRQTIEFYRERRGSVKPELKRGYPSLPNIKNKKYPKAVRPSNPSHTRPTSEIAILWALLGEDERVNRTNPITASAVVASSPDTNNISVSPPATAPKPVVPSEMD